jgi:hypothetical protein
VVNCLSSFPSAYPHVPKEIHALSTWSPPTVLSMNALFLT